MDRGPVALFGAIVAVGLGPAMWLGAQFGSIEVDPSRPPAIVGEPNSAPDQLVGGAGAADASSGDDAVINGTPQSEAVPARTTTSPPRRRATASPAATAATSSPTPTPTRSTEAPTTPPTGSTSSPATPPTGGTSSPTLPPEPPVEPAPLSNIPKVDPLSETVHG